MVFRHQLHDAWQRHSYFLAWRGVVLIDVQFFEPKNGVRKGQHLVKQTEDCIEHLAADVQVEQLVLLETKSFLLVKDFLYKNFYLLLMGDTHFETRRVGRCVFTLLGRAAYS